MGLLSDLKDEVNQAEEVLLQGYPAESSTPGLAPLSIASHSSWVETANAASGVNGDLYSSPSLGASIVDRLSSSSFMRYLGAVDGLQRVVDTCPPKVASTKQLINKARTLLSSAIGHLEEDFILLLRASSSPPTADQVHAAARSLPPTKPGAERTSSSDDASPSGSSSTPFNDGLPSDSFLLFPSAAATCLQSLAARLLTAGREEACLGALSQIRKAWLDAAVSKLIEKGQLRAEEVPLLDWEDLEERVLTWQTFAKITVRVLLAQERKLCNYVLQNNTKLTSRCFGELAGSSGTALTSFVETFALDKRLPERLFSMLDCCETLSRMEGDFLTSFQGESRDCVRLRGEYSAIQKRVGLAALGIFAEFEAVIERDSSRVPPGGPGAGAVPKSTSYVMNYLALLYEYRDTLVGLLPELPPGSLARRRQGGSGRLGSRGRGAVAGGEEEEDVEEGDEEEEDEEEEGASGREFWADGEFEFERLAAAVLWKLSVLRGNYEAKAKAHIGPKDPALASLFLMNNIHYVARKVKESDLRRLLGDDWIRQQAMAVRSHADSYIQITWGKLAATLNSVVKANEAPELLKRSTVKQIFKQFNTAVEDVHRAQSVWLVTPGPLRDELRVAIRKYILPAYSAFYDAYAQQLLTGRHPTKYVKYDPLSVKDIIMELFSGNTGKM